MKQALSYGPVSVAMYSSGVGFSLYSGGVYSCALNVNSASLDHGVLVVGYVGTTSWIIKNSWGTSWGDYGYGYLSQSETHNCGILIEAYRIFSARLLLSCIAILMMVLIH